MNRSGAILLGLWSPLNDWEEPLYFAEDISRTFLNIYSQMLFHFNFSAAILLASLIVQYLLIFHFVDIADDTVNERPKSI